MKTDIFDEIMFIYKRCVITSEPRRNLTKMHPPAVKCKVTFIVKHQVLTLDLSTATSDCFCNTWLAAFTVSVCFWLLTALEATPSKDTPSRLFKFQNGFTNSLVLVGDMHLYFSPTFNIDSDCEHTHQHVATSRKALFSIYALFPKSWQKGHALQHAAVAPVAPVTGSRGKN